MQQRQQQQNPYGNPYGQSYGQSYGGSSQGSYQQGNPYGRQQSGGYSGCYGQGGWQSDFGGFGFDDFFGFGGYQTTQAPPPTEQPGDSELVRQAIRDIQQRAYNSAVLHLQNVVSGQRNARWYYISALANHGLHNQVTALEHIRKAVSMEPDNYEYLQTLQYMQQGGDTYRQQAGNFRGFSMRGNPCASAILCWFVNFFCCRCC